MELHNTKIDLPADKRGQIIDILNRRLADATDLKSQAKQAHWNVKGANFIALHELFDEISTEVEAHIDEIAERVTRSAELRWERFASRRKTRL
jgi:starvation-inducible DNA-binding protein